MSSSNVSILYGPAAIKTVLKSFLAFQCCSSIASHVFPSSHVLRLLPCCSYLDLYSSWEFSNLFCVQNILWDSVFFIHSHFILLCWFFYIPRHLFFNFLSFVASFLHFLFCCNLFEHWNSLYLYLYPLQLLPDFY